MKRFQMMNMALVILAAALSCSVNGDSGEGDSGQESAGNRNGSDDPYQGIRAPARGEIGCNGDNCCYFYCSGAGDGISCATRDPSLIMTMYDDLPDSCKGLIFPEWFYAHDCFVVHETPNSKTGDWDRFQAPITDHPTYGQITTLCIDCFCGRANGRYAGSAHYCATFHWRGCDQELEPIDDEHETKLFICDEDCFACQPECGTKECGPDGCGGSCGQCPAGETCNAVGSCVSDTSGDTCSKCLASCRGLPGCCTGCGCLCEYECGGCF